MKDIAKGFLFSLGMFIFITLAGTAFFTYIKISSPQLIDYTIDDYLEDRILDILPY